MLSSRDAPTDNVFPFLISRVRRPGRAPGVEGAPAAAHLPVPRGQPAAARVPAGTLEPRA